MTKKLIALLLLLVTFSIAHAETFVVTSNADSGPGTLREAIEKAAANGSSETDYIHFNIAEPGFNKRIINLEDELPALTSNLVIDGTTQPGEAYATTTAKICLKKDDYATEFSMLKIQHASNIRIYGLFLYYGYWKGFFGPPMRSNKLYDINLSDAFNIYIGAPGKGNVIAGAVDGIYSASDSCRNLVIQSNVIGLGGYYYDIDQTKDIADVVLESQSAIRLQNVKDVTIGGATAAEGNIIASAHGIYMDSDHPTGNGFIMVRFNRFNRWYDNQKLIYRFTFERFIALCGSDDNPVDYRVSILDNDIPSYLQLANLTQPFLMQRNVFGADFRDNRHELKCAIWNCSGGGTIGSESDAGKNHFFTKQPNTYYWSLGWGQSGPITVLKNTFDCNSGYGSTILSEAPLTQMPLAQVDETTPTFVRGHATPDCRIDLYYDDPCTACEGKTYIATIRSDASGNWRYNGPITGTVVVLAIDSRGYTSEFSVPTFNYDSVVVTQPTCGKKNGSITGFTSEGAEAWYWINNRTHDTVSRTIELHSVGPGYYTLLGRHGEACWQPINQDYQLEDQSPQIRRDWENIVQPACGANNGSITGFVVEGITDHTKMVWTDAQGNLLGTEPDLIRLLPETYTFRVTDTVEGCSDAEAVTLTNQSGPSLNTGNMKITAASCGGSNGSIKGIKARNITGTPKIHWENEQGDVISNDLDLINVPGGKYRLKFKDDSSCDTITTAYYTIGGSNATTIDATNAKITASQCAYASGSVKNITVSNATDFEWNDGNGVVVSRSLDPGLLLPGTYTLTAGKSTGCPKTSSAITVPVDPDMQFNPALQTTITPATCGRTNGSVVLQNFPSPQSYTFQWKQGSDDRATTLNLTNTASGDYTLFATNASGCTQRVTSVTIPNRAQPVLQTNAVTLHHDVCTQGIGRIENLSVQPGTGTPPFAYQWFNAQGQVIANTANLQNNKAGSYYLMITDATGCTVKTAPFVVLNETKNLEPPRYADQVIPRHTGTTLTPQSGAIALFERFADAALTQRLDAANNGVFAVPELAADKTFYIRLREGTCTSTATSVTIKVADDAQVYVPTAFTPNRDGKNDVLKPLVIGIFKLEHFTIYDRWGGVVFRSNDLTKGWDGFIKGAEAPIGVYVWMLAGMDYKGNRMQQKGSFTLMR